MGIYTRVKNRNQIILPLSMMSEYGEICYAIQVFLRSNLSSAV